MNDKIQMTEEQFERCYTFFMNISWNENYKDVLKRAKDKGLVNKSELEKSVEECEEMIESNIIHNRDYIVVKEQKKILEAIQALKKSHPEFKNE